MRTRLGKEKKREDDAEATDNHKSGVKFSRMENTCLDMEHGICLPLHSWSCFEWRFARSTAVPGTRVEVT